MRPAWRDHRTIWHYIDHLSERCPEVFLGVYRCRRLVHKYPTKHLFDIRACMNGTVEKVRSVHHSS